MSNCSALARIKLPLPEPHRARLRSIRRGEVPLTEVLGETEQTKIELARLAASGSVPNQPGRSWLDAWL